MLNRHLNTVNRLEIGVLVGALSVVVHSSVLHEPSFEALIMRISLFECVLVAEHRHAQEP